MAGFAEELRAARKSAGLSQQAIATAVGISQAYLAQIETGRRGVEQSPDLVARLERALGLPAGALAQHLPPDHPARRMAAVELPVLGVVAAGPARDEPAEPGEVLRVSDVFAGCVAYRVRGDSMTEALIHDGDYLVVRPADASPPEVGQVVVAWLNSMDGYVAKRLGENGVLCSAGWEHRLSDEDRVVGVVLGVIRFGFGNGVQDE